jgi:ketosteroid isomerase-like protein
LAAKASLLPVVSLISGLLNSAFTLGVAENKDVVRRQFQLISEGNAKGAASLFAPISLNHGRQVDREGITKVLESLVLLHERFTIHEIVGEGDWVACRAVVTGKYDSKPSIPVDSGIHSLVPASGQEYTFQHIHLFKVVDGKILEHWANRDDLGAARQLGLELRPSGTK